MIKFLLAFIFASVAYCPNCGQLIDPALYDSDAQMCADCLGI